MNNLLKFSGHAVLFTAVFIEGGFAQNAWINEIHYDNANSDVNESVEVVIQDAESYNLADFSLVLYNGGNGATYNTKTLDIFTTGAVSQGYSFFYYVYPSNGMQNGAPDGLALAYQGILISGQFLSYEGSFTATNGPANGQISFDIGVSESGNDPAGNSLQLAGTGWVYVDYTWLPPAPETAGQLNNNQAFGEPPTPEPSDYPADFSASIIGLVAHLSWTDASGNQLPENYLVTASDQDTVMVPSDGIMQPDDPDLSDGAGSLNVPYGTQSCVFFRLDDDKTYYFYIFPYTNQGPEINYKTDNEPPYAEDITVHEINGNDFEDGSFGSWEMISLASDKDWAISNESGAYQTLYSCRMDGCQENLPSNDWLISPSLDLDFSTGEIMEFQSEWSLGDSSNELTLKYSTDYFGGNPGQANWTELAFMKAQDSMSWASSGILDLSEINSDNVHIAFQYLSSGDPRRWNIDEIEITGIPVESTITVISPEQGEQWERSSFHDISWTAENNQANMRIEFTDNASSDDPAWTVLNPSVPASAGTWVWNIPPAQSISDDCQVKVTDIASKGEGLSGIFSVINSSYIPRLVITEIMYNPPESGSDTLEFIELFNDDESPVNLEGYYFSKGITYTFPELVMEPGTYILLAIDSAIFQAAYGVPSLQYDGSLSNNGESLELLNFYDMVIDSLTFNDTSPWPTGPDGDGPSLALWEPGLDNAMASNWTMSTDLAYINAGGDSLFATPGWARIILPVADFSGNPARIYEGETVDFIDLSTGMADSWLWEFEGAIPPASTDQNPSGILYPNPGLYDVKLTVNNLFGADIMLKEDYIDVMPVGIDEQSESMITIYPNPNKGSFRLNNRYNEELLASIYSTYGQLIFERIMMPGNNYVELAGVSEGIYVIYYRYPSVIKVGSKKLIVY
jgi:hypothetical protein